ncbi:transglycosylase SLT domain-containing protein [Aquibacillus saliphilus]|uniref:transglycosylase SLT domain-containing protein n=1 Tax=Aquibacillus saliphilus TaxID=1909422 RepID=UPI001CEFE7B3|nr:transglycosylase SLT domain-containing protein [Aquibacillus saliphilus]
MMEWIKRKYLILLVAVIMLSGIVMYSINHISSNNYGELVEENEQLTQENNKLMAQQDYLTTSSMKSESENGYHTWPEIEKNADAIVKDSNNNFKKSWALYLVKEANRYDIDPYLAYELLKVETGGTFDPKLVGPETKYGHAYGLAQFMKNTAPWIAEMADLPYEDELLFDPYYSMQISLVYLDFLHHEYGNWNEVLTAYHRGMAGLDQYIRDNGHAKSNYAEMIQESAADHASLALK